jgi:hypothetical protein
MSKWRTRALLGMTGALFIAGAASTALGAASCGDLNTSGARDSGDAVRLNLAIATSPSATDCGGSGSLSCGDLKKDGVLDVADLVFMVQLLAQTETLLAPCTNLSDGGSQCGGTLPNQIKQNRVVRGTASGCSTPTLVDGPTFVNGPAVLTIEPGAVVAGKQTSTSGETSVLVITRDAKINAAGNASAPIVFTSDQAIVAGGTDGNPDDWGGIVILGRAPVNFLGGTGNSEGLPLGQGIFGGNEPNDSSGVIRFARIEFSGRTIGTDNELNVLTMNALGRGTTIDHVQTNAGDDDCFEWFGGTIRSKHLLATSCKDDQFDYQIGFTGALQFGLAYQSVAVANAAAGGGRHGIEGDNNEFGFDLEPRSNPNFCNLTLIGASRQTGGAIAGRSGANIRRGSAGKIFNSLFMDWTAGILDIDNTETINRACDADSLLDASQEPRLLVSGIKGFNFGADASTGSAMGGPAFCSTADALWDKWGLAGLVDPASANGTAGTDPMLGGVAAGTAGGITATFPTAVDDRYFPPSGTLGATPCGLEPDFFDAAPYIGAFEPGGSTGGGDNWLTGNWVNFGTD